VQANEWLFQVIKCALKGINVDVLVATVVGYSGILAPVLSLWAIATLCLHSQEADFGYCQTVFFGAMMLIGFLTVRTMLIQDTSWLLNATSLGVLIVGGALKGSTESQSSLLSGN